MQRRLARVNRCKRNGRATKVNSSPAKWRISLARRAGATKQRIEAAGDRASSPLLALRRRKTNAQRERRRSAP